MVGHPWKVLVRRRLCQLTGGPSAARKATGGAATEAVGTRLAFESFGKGRAKRTLYGTKWYEIRWHSCAITHSAGPTQWPRHLPHWGGQATTIGVPVPQNPASFPRGGPDRCRLNRVPALPALLNSAPAASTVASDYRQSGLASVGGQPVPPVHGPARLPGHTGRGLARPGS